MKVRGESRGSEGGLRGVTEVKGTQNTAKLNYDILAIALTVRTSTGIYKQSKLELNNTKCALSELLD